MDEALRRAIAHLVDSGFELETLTPDGRAELRRGSRVVRLRLSGRDVLISEVTPPASHAPPPAEALTAAEAVAPSPPERTPEPEPEPAAPPPPREPETPEAEAALEDLVAAERAEAPPAHEDAVASAEREAAPPAAAVPPVTSPRTSPSRAERVVLRLLVAVLVLALAAVALLAAREQTGTAIEIPFIQLEVSLPRVGELAVGLTWWGRRLPRARGGAGGPRPRAARRTAGARSATIGRFRGHVAKW